MKDEVITGLATLMTASVGMVAALAWDDAVKTVMDRYYPQKGEGVRAKVAYATTVTVFSVIATIWIAKSAKKAKEIKILD